MSPYRVLFATAALTSTFGICLALYRWGAGSNRDLAVLVREVRRSEELPPDLEATWRRVEAQQAVAAEVAAGRLSVREAAGHFRRLDEENPSHPAGTLRPPEDELVLCGRVLGFTWEHLAERQRFAAAARCHAEAFATLPQLLGDRPTGHRYWAASAAAQAGCGQGQDAADLAATSRAGFRRQALDWLRTELEAWRRLLEQEPEQALVLVANLKEWRRHPSFAGVREPDALARLPESERQAWRRLWVDVTETLARAEGTTPPEQQAGRKVQRPGR
jgi:hypothetical protein